MWKKTLLRLVKSLVREFNYYAAHYFAYPLWSGGIKSVGGGGGGGVNRKDPNLGIMVKIWTKIDWWYRIRFVIMLSNYPQLQQIQFWCLRIIKKWMKARRCVKQTNNWADTLKRKLNYASIEISPIFKGIENQLDSSINSLSFFFGAISQFIGFCAFVCSLTHILRMKAPPKMHATHTCMWP